jgi:hypothetical protein
MGIYNSITPNRFGANIPRWNVRIILRKPSGAVGKYLLMFA